MSEVALLMKFLSSIRGPIAQSWKSVRIAMVPKTEPRWKDAFDDLYNYTHTHKLFPIIWEQSHFAPYILEVIVKFFMGVGVEFIVDGPAPSLTNETVDYSNGLSCRATSATATTASTTKCPSYTRTYTTSSKIYTTVLVRLRRFLSGPAELTFGRAHLPATRDAERIAQAQVPTEYATIQHVPR